ncbi:MAG TPA: four helix bundle protein, partial [Chloroflexota bacterium]
MGAGSRESVLGVGSRESGVGEVRSFRDLRVWQAGMDLVESSYRLTQGFPNSELYGLVSQIRRAAVSVPANIAEGYVRESTREYLQHLSIAQGSLGELETHFEIAARLAFLSPGDLQALLEAISSLRKQLFKLRD